MDINEKYFTWHSQRAQLSRYGRSIKPWVFAMTLATFGLFFLGVLCLVFRLPIGWALIGMAPVPALILHWYEIELANVPVQLSTRTIEARMDSELLGLLSPQPTPKELALALMSVNGGLFFEIRLGVGGSFLKEVASQNPDDTAAIFEEALAISEQMGQSAQKGQAAESVQTAQTAPRISPGVLILAMIRQLPARAALLGHLQLDENDILRGIEWYHHLQALIEDDKQQSKSQGGIGRDWSFGWIPYLSRFGINISQSGTMSRGDVHADELTQLMAMLANGSGSIALIGKDGVGKTELVYELATKLIRPDKTVPKVLRYQQVLLLDASRIVAAAPGRGELENLVTGLLAEAYDAKNIIVCLDNAELFFEEGPGSVDLTSVLLPIVEAGRLRMLMTIDEQKYLQISKRTPALINALNPVNIQPTDQSETMTIMEDHLPLLEHKHGVTYMYQSLKEAYKLGSRYIYDVSMPGQALTLLERAADYPENGLVTMRSVNQAIEKTTGVKTAPADDAAERDMLLNLEGLIHQRMVGQERAVSVVADALRRARSGVRNQNRPVGTFLFLGPTGVGKTELAKAVASVYFGGEKNIIRLDMNEFVTVDDVARLIADGADDPASLTAQVMKQPFSVVLLDEIEKAHSSVLTTLLQLLDEGILRDVRNREISFKDTVVIATSNAGAERIREYIQRGYNLQQFEETFVNELISSHLFHPEFLNRFDEIVVFAPLTKEQLLRVVDLILVDVNKNLAEQQITITVADDAKVYLVDVGYDPRLGARPMRRVVQKAVENTVAKLLLAGSITPGGTLEISKDQVEAILGTKAKADEIIAGSSQAISSGQTIEGNSTEHSVETTKENSGASNGN